MNEQRRQPNIRTFSRVMLALILLGAIVSWNVMPAAAATKIDIPGPTGSVVFGKSVTVLPNGNFVVRNPHYDGGIGVDAGAVFLYNGGTGVLISTLTGGKAGDMVGYRVTALSNGNYVVSSPSWDNGGVADAGAVTWGSGTSGVSGTVSSANSLVGSQVSDEVGYDGVTALSNGDYVVRSPFWRNGGATNAGAVTWGSGTSGIHGEVSLANSLVGSQVSDVVGAGGVTALSNGNYVVNSMNWDNGWTADVGAATWGNGTGGTTGAVSATNSLVGSQTNDKIGWGGMTALSNGNYVVSSTVWDNGATASAGAATWGNGNGGTTGAVSAANSLVGTHTADNIGRHVTELSNGNYVVSSMYWDNGAATDAGAATWSNGSGGTTGVVSAANSLVGSQTNDYVGYDLIGLIGVTALSNGNYVVNSPYWDNVGTADAGAASWGNGSSGTTGAVSVTNSLVGSQSSDLIGWHTTALSNGNYVVKSVMWDNGGTSDAGAATWGNGSSGTTGVVSAANSLVGSQTDDQVGIDVTRLSNGNYVVNSAYWDNGGAADVGAVTWGNGSSGTTGAVSTSNSLVGSQTGDKVGLAHGLCNGNYVVVSMLWDNGVTVDAGAVTWVNGSGVTTGVVSTANSLVGSQTNDTIGSYGVTALSNGNYVVSSPVWDNGATTDAGAATWGNGSSGVSGTVSSANSLVGNQVSDEVSWGGVTALGNGNYVVSSPVWNNGGTADVGAVTWGFGASGLVGYIDGDNSVIGTTVGGGMDMVFAYDEVNHQLVVGRPADNMVTLFRLPYLFLPISKK